MYRSLQCLRTYQKPAERRARGDIVLVNSWPCILLFNSMTYDRDSGHKSFLEDVFQNESRLPGGSWGPSSVPWTDVVSIQL